MIKPPKVFALDNDKALIGTYSPGTLVTILEAEKLLAKNLNSEVVEILNPIIKKNTVNEFEKSSLYFLLGTAHHNLKNFPDANISFLSVLTYDRIPLLLHLESLRKLSPKFLNEVQKEFVFKRIEKINNKQTNVDLLISLAEFLYDSSDFDRAIKILNVIDRNRKPIATTQSTKLNELFFLAYIGNSQLTQALKKIELAVESNPNKANLRRLAYTYALLNERDNHLNTWETINDNFLLDLSETKYFYKLLLQRDFHLKAEQVFIYGLKNGFFEPKDKPYQEFMNKWKVLMSTNEVN